MSVAELVGILIGGGGLVFALLAWLSSRRSVELAERSLDVAAKQLTLAKRQAETRPVLDAIDAMLFDGEGAEEVMEVRRVQYEWSHRQGTEPLALDPESLEQRDYVGPFPDKVLVIQLVNLGTAAAHEVSGKVFFEAEHLEPFEFPGLCGFNILRFERSRDDTTQRQKWAWEVSVVDDEGSKLLPFIDDRLDFTIALLVLSSGETRVEYVFTTPQGDDTRGEFQLQI